MLTFLNNYLAKVLWTVSEICLKCFTLLVGRQEEHPACKKWGDGGVGHWLVQMEWCPGGWSVCLPLLVFPCTIKSRSSILVPDYPDGPGKRVVVVVYQKFIHFCHKLQPEWHDITKVRLKMPLNPNQPTNNVLYRPNLVHCSYVSLLESKR